MSLRLTGGLVVRTLDPPRVEAADLLVRDGRISALTGEPGEERVPARDCSGCLVVPGNVVAHTHAYSALARGMPYRLPPPVSFLQILQRVWWRLDRALDPESIRASALVAALEAVRSGTSTLIDHHASPSSIDGSLDIVAEAFEEVGIRAVLCYETSDRDGQQRAMEGIDENRRFLQRVSEGRWPLARGMVGAHASFTVSDDTLAACVETARHAGVGIHLHLAEDAVDETDSLARCDRRTGVRLQEAGVLDGRALAAHAVHVDPSEAALLRASGATVVHNPRSNMHNGVGRAPLAWLGERVALGTDGIDGDLFAESRAAYFRRREEEVETPPALALRLLAGSASVAAACFHEPALGRLDPGAPADLAVLDYEAPVPVDEATLGGHWTFGLGAAAVRDVMVAGEFVLRDRQPTRVDGRAVALEAQQATRGLWHRLEQLGPHPFAPSVLLATAGEA